MTAKITLQEMKIEVCVYYYEADFDYIARKKRYALL